MEHVPGQIAGSGYCNILPSTSECGSAHSLISHPGPSAFPGLDKKKAAEVGFPVTTASPSHSQVIHALPL